MASTFPGQVDTFTLYPYVDGTEYIYAAYANAWVSAILAIESTIGTGVGSSSSNPLYSAQAGSSFSSLAARMTYAETLAGATARIDPAVGDIQPVGQTASAGAIGLSADSGHRHVGVSVLSATAPVTVSGGDGAGHGALTVALPGAMVTSVYDSAAVGGQLVNTSTPQTLTGKRITRRSVTVTQSATPTINTNNGDLFIITALAQAVTSFTQNLTGTPVVGDLMRWYVTDNGTAQTLAYGTSFESSSQSPPGTTVAGMLLTIMWEWNAVTSKWRFGGSF